MYAAHAAYLLRKPHITLEDTFNQEQVRLYKPFTDVILTGDYSHPDLGEKQIRYKGYHELAYLHPNYFRPDKAVLEELGIKENGKYVIIRFVSWQATHDAGHKGISFENKLKAIKEFEKYARVFISSEAVLPPELEPYRIKIEPHRMHDVISFATLLFGEGATMASEAAVLGTPAIYLNNSGLGYTDEEENKYGLVFNYTESEEDQLRAIEKGIEILNTPNVKEQWQEKRKKMLTDKIDVTAFLVWFVEHYPESVRMMRERPDYQERFK
jgi:predicted glycosyltransferase